eukprot:UN05979
MITKCIIEYHYVIYSNIILIAYFKCLLICLKGSND